MSLVTAGFHDPRAEVAGTSNAWGDHVGHTASRSAASQTVIAAMVVPMASAAAIRDGDGARLIGDFVAWARAHGVRAIGGLPTELDQAKRPDATRAAMAAIYLAHGGAFLLLSNRSRYPTAAFFDTPLHLNEPCQIAHSIMLARALAPLLGRTVRAPPAPVPDCSGLPVTTTLAQTPR